MIQVLFNYVTEIILVTIRGTDIRFATSDGIKEAPIDGLKLSHEGVVKEFPDLKDKENWKEEAIKRFKEKIATMKSEDEICNYIIEDLRSYGYVPKYKQKQGFRRELIK